jgi:hypothetical protein
MKRPDFIDAPIRLPSPCTNCRRAVALVGARGAPDAGVASCVCGRRAGYLDRDQFEALCALVTRPEEPITLRPLSDMPPRSHP